MTNQEIAFLNAAAQTLACPSATSAEVLATVLGHLLAERGAAPAEIARVGRALSKVGATFARGSVEVLPDPFEDREPAIKEARRWLAIDALARLEAHGEFLLSFEPSAPDPLKASFDDLVAAGFARVGPSPMGADRVCYSLSDLGRTLLAAKAAKGGA